MNLKKIFVIIIFCATLASSVWAEESETPPAAPGAQSEQKIQGFNLQGYNDAGDKAWDVNGTTADFKGQEITLSNVDANSYGEEKVNLTAEKGTINQTSGDMRLEKDVMITSERGMQMMTDSLNWNRKDDLVTTQDGVVITDKNMMVKGTGMKASPGLNSAEISQDVTARVNTEPKKDNGRIVTITSDGPMMIDQVKLTATFDDNVVATQGDRMLKADRMIVHFQPDMKGITDMICIGNVEITQGENKTYAEKATYESATQKVTLSGRPKLIMETDKDNGIAAFTN